jgi:hypothetical protein
MTEALTTELAQISTLKVISRLGMRNAVVLTKPINSRMVGNPEVILGPDRFAGQVNAFYIGSIYRKLTRHCTILQNNFAIREFTLRAWERQFLAVPCRA